MGTRILESPYTFASRTRYFTYESASPSYPSQQSSYEQDGYQSNAGGGGYSRRAPNPYAQQDENPFDQGGGYEMADVQNSRANLTAGVQPPAGAGGDDMSAFYEEARLPEHILLYL